MIGKIEKIKDIREVWPKEDKDFTPWLCENMDELGQCIGVELGGAENEVTTGNFFVDIIAKDGNDNNVVIENQYGKSNHDHLGKLLTYASTFNAKGAVWIVEQASTEHITAINTLNEHYNGCDFFLVKLEAVRIGDSNIAPLFTKLAGPDESTSLIKKHNELDDEKKKEQYNFWSRFVTKCVELNYKSFSTHTPSKGPFMTSGSGIGGVYYQCWAFKSTVRIELKFNKPDKEDNRTLFNKLKEKQALIESFYGRKLVWVDNDTEKMCSLREDHGGGTSQDESDMDDTILWCIESLRRLEEATKKYLKE